MKKILFISMLILSSLLVNAAMDQFSKECLQRGYETAYYDGIKYCVFSDGVKCPLDAFNNGLCGSEYKIEPYCVKEGNPVWDTDKCCEGTEAYSRPGHMAQPSCLKVSLMQKLSDYAKYNPFLPIGVIIFIGFIVWLIRKRKIVNSP